jgi:catechol 2,3-dioxygenase-like lactoylglutathione lyase family enzyme
VARIQLALNVDNIDSAVDFYSKLFGVEPAKRRDGYANFAIAEPPLKLVLMENRGQGGTLNHLGVEVETPEDVAAAILRLRDAHLDTVVEENTTCCYAVQDKVWVHGPDAEPWEVYTVLADAQVMHDVPEAGERACCTSEPVTEPVTEPTSIGVSGPGCC